MPRRLCLVLAVVTTALAACSEPGPVLARHENSEAFRVEVQKALPLGTRVSAFTSSMRRSHFHCSRGKSSRGDSELVCTHCELRDNETKRLEWQIVATEKDGAVATLQAGYTSAPLLFLRDVCE